MHFAEKTFQKFCSVQSIIIRVITDRDSMSIEREVASGERLYYPLSEVNRRGAASPLGDAPPDRAAYVRAPPCRAHQEHVRRVAPPCGGEGRDGGRPAVGRREAHRLGLR